MATYRYDENGNKVQISKYEVIGAKKLTDMFPEAKETAAMIVRRPGVRGRLADKYKVRSSSRLVRLIFFKFMMKMLEHVAEGEIFMLPGRSGAHILLKPVKDEHVRKARQNGNMKDIDIVKANFKVPMFTYDFGYRHNRRDVNIYVPKDLYMVAVHNTEEGKIPWTSFRKQLKYDSNVRGHT